MTACSLLGPDTGVVCKILENKSRKKETEKGNRRKDRREKRVYSGFSAVADLYKSFQCLNSPTRLSIDGFPSWFSPAGIISHSKTCSTRSKCAQRTCCDKRRVLRKFISYKSQPRRVSAAIVYVHARARSAFALCQIYPPSHPERSLGEVSLCATRP